MKQINVTDEQYEFLKFLTEQRKTQNNRSTADPIWLAQTKRFRICDEDYAEPDCYQFYGDCDVLFYADDMNDFKIKLKEWLDENEYEGYEPFDDIDFLFEAKDWIEEFRTKHYNSWQMDLVPMEAYWETVAYFLTDVEAKAYIEYQSHNLCEPRTYVDYCGYANHGDLPKLMKLLLELNLE